MGEASQNWISDMVIEDGDLFNKRYKMMDPLMSEKDEMFPPEIMYRQAYTQNKTVSVTDTNNLVRIPQIAPQTQTSPTPYVLSFGDSATRESYAGKQSHIGQVAALPPLGQRPMKTAARKVRSSAETVHHIMAERKRRRELTERFIALSATIPGLKKIDKATILSEAIKHVKGLKERVRELEEQRKKSCVESVSFIQKSHIATEKGSTSSQDDVNVCYKSTEALPTVEVRVFKKDILLRIHCKIASGILLRILDHLKSLDLSTISNSVMPFGNSTLDITIVAQMGEKFKVTMDDVVKNLRLALLQSFEEQQ